MSKSNKMLGIKLAKLEKLVTEIYPEYQKAFKKAGESVGLNLSLSNCIPLNGLACQRLIDNGFNARLVGGKAAFSVNKGKHGILDYGYSKEAITANGETETDDVFLGHCWIEIKKLGVIVDLTLPHLEKTFAHNNQQLGINDNEFVFSKSMIVPINDNKSFNALMEGALGYHYLTNAQDTTFVNEQYRNVEPLVDGLMD